MELERLVEERLLHLGLKPKEVNLRSILLELRAWLRPSVEGSGIVRTAGFDYTLIHPQYGEPYHSLTAGAVMECLQKFLMPSGILQRAKNIRRLRLLDVGFGLGYNVVVALKRLKDINPKLEIEVLSLDKELPENIPPPPEEFRELHGKILDSLPNFEGDGISLKLFIGDARKTIKEISSFKAHAVFHDAFSPYKNPELWSLQFLAEIKRLMRRDGVWVSYTSSLSVRKALKGLGFKLSSTTSLGRKRKGTRASLVGREELEEKERLKLFKSPYAIPLLDPDFSRKPIEILVDYRVRVELLKVAQGGVEPPTPRFSAVCSTN